jgi:hypothetical protein
MAKPTEETEEQQSQLHNDNSKSPSANLNMKCVIDMDGSIKSVHSNAFNFSKNGFSSFMANLYQRKMVETENSHDQNHLQTTTTSGSQCGS